MPNPVSLPGPFTLNSSAYTNPNYTTPTGPTAIVHRDDLNGMREQIKDSAALLYETIHRTSPHRHPSMNIATTRNNLFIVFSGSPPNIHATVIVAKPGDHSHATQQTTPTETKPYVFVRSRTCKDQSAALLALWALVSGALDEAMQEDPRYTDLALYGGDLHVLAAARAGGTIVRMAPVIAAPAVATPAATGQPLNEDDHNFELRGWPVLGTEKRQLLGLLAIRATMTLSRSRVVGVRGVLERSGAEKR